MLAGFGATTPLVHITQGTSEGVRAVTVKSGETIGPLLTHTPVTARVGETFVNVTSTLLTCHRKYSYNVFRFVSCGIIKDNIRRS